MTVDLKLAPKAKRPKGGSLLRAAGVPDIRDEVDRLVRKLIVELEEATTERRARTP